MEKWYTVLYLKKNLNSKMYITIIQSINDGLLFSLFLVHMVGQHDEVVDKLSQENLFIRIVQFILLFIVAY